MADPERRLFVVADGMGGHAAGEIASKIAVETVEEIVSSLGPDTEIPEILQLAVREANARVFEAQSQNPEYRGMGSTLTALALDDDRYHVAQVGDSRAYLFREGTLSQLTRDHSVVWRLYEACLIEKDDLPRHPQKNLITRSIGTRPEVEPELAAGAAAPGDIFLLCSDGLTDVLPDDAIERILDSSGASPSDLCSKLVEAANAGGGPDNVTTIVVRLE